MCVGGAAGVCRTEPVYPSARLPERSMQPLALALICLCLALSAQGQKPRPCASPPLLEGRMSVFDPKEHATVYGQFSYDAFGRKYRIREVVTVKNKTLTVDKLLLYRQAVQYTISYHNHTCEKSALEAHFQPIQIPPDAEFLSQVILGGSSSPGEGLLVNVWKGKVPETQGTYISTFTEFGCLPISNLYYSNSTGWIASSFYDITRGIRNPNVLIPPSFCNHKDEEAGSPKI